MALIDDLTAELAIYEAARVKAATAQSYGIAGSSKQMADLFKIQGHIDMLRSRIARLPGTSITVVQAEFIPGTSGSNNGV